MDSLNLYKIQKLHFVALRISLGDMTEKYNPNEAAKHKHIENL